MALEIEVAPGKHKIRVEKEGYEPIEVEVEVKAGETKELKFTLKPKVAKIVIETEPEGATVYIDGKPVGRT